jgi:hypothetical protein
MQKFMLKCGKICFLENVSVLIEYIFSSIPTYFAFSCKNFITVAKCRVMIMAARWPLKT